MSLRLKKNYNQNTRIKQMNITSPELHEKQYWKCKCCPHRRRLAENIMLLNDTTYLNIQLGFKSNTPTLSFKSFFPFPLFDNLHRGVILTVLY